MSLILALLACQPEPECLDHTDCPEGQGCVGELPETECVIAECFANADCPYSFRCETPTLKCELGCDGNSDCPAAYDCVSGECLQLGVCEDTQRDCAIGELCSGGDCVDMVGVCDECWSTCTGGHACLGGYCYPRCSSQADCPSGFSCWEEQGYCTNDCQWLEQNGYI